MLPPLMKRVTEMAPQVNIAAVQTDRRELESELAAGTLDLAIDVLLPLSSAVLHTQIETDTTVVLVHKNHPLVRGSLDLETYLQQDHILATSRRKGPGMEDFELSRLGLQRRVRLRCQHYFAACRVVSQTNLLLTMRERYARVVNEQFGNQILPFPLALPSFDAHLYWHANVDADPANLWLREQIIHSLQSV